ncbi:hypothetical protein I4U23_025539 [Adineta vaga]|nr:hypothetical protein I4U23_025539 [Adineta vaga]
MIQYLSKMLNSNYSNDVQISNTTDNQYQNEKPLSLTLTLQLNDQFLQQNHPHPSVSDCENSAALINDKKTQSIACQTPNKSSNSLNLSTVEINTLKKISATINQIIENEATPSTSEIEHPRSSSSSVQMERNEHKKQCYQRQRQIIDVAKQELKPIFKQHIITKRQYKKIMKKVVTKATYAEKTDYKWIKRMINAYVNEYRTVYS